MNAGRIILDSLMYKLASNPDSFASCLRSIRKYYRVTLIIPDNGIPLIEYGPANSSKNPKKSILFVDLLFADKKHDTNEKYAISFYTTDKTISFLAQDETTMNEWLTKTRECHAELYPEFKHYDVIFEANLIDKGLAKTMNIHGTYRLALCKDSLDLIPLLTHNENSHNSSSGQKPENASPNSNHHHLTQQVPSHQRFHKRHPLLSSKTIELVRRSIRRCGHTDSNFYIESGRHSQVGEGDLWMALNKRSTAKQLHELFAATMKLGSVTEDQFLCKATRSRSGSSTMPTFTNKIYNSEDDSGYLPMA